MFYLSLAGFATLLGIAAFTDVRQRRIPNWTTGALVALYPLYVLAAPSAVAWPMSLAGAGVMFLVGVLLFARGWLGGGDVKLFAAVSLWAGVDHLALFAIVTSLAGGVLAFGNLSWQRLLGPLGLHLEALLPGGSSATGSNADRAAPATLPYGIAIAAGGLVIAFELVKP